MLENSYILFLGILLGFKHALEPDHIVAISTIVYKNKNPFKAAFNGILWGVGHTFTIFLVGFIILTSKLSISEDFASLLEKGVGIMIIFLGIKTLINSKKIKQDSNKDNDTNDNNKSHIHSHPHVLEGIKPFLIGTIQGLAGSAALIILTLSTVHSTFLGLMFILTFGLGTIIAMFSYSLIISFSLKKINNSNLQIQLNILVGTLSTAFGIYYVAIL